MTSSEKTKIVGAMVLCEMADYVSSNGYQMSKDDLIQIIKEMAIAIEEARETFNEKQAYKMAVKGLKENL